MHISQKANKKQPLCIDMQASVCSWRWLQHARPPRGPPRIQKGCWEIPGSGLQPSIVIENPLKLVKHLCNCRLRHSQGFQFRKSGDPRNLHFHKPGPGDSAAFWRSFGGVSLLLHWRWPLGEAVALYSLYGEETQVPHLLCGWAAQDHCGVVR